MESKEFQELIRTFRQSGLKTMRLELPGVRLELEAESGAGRPEEPVCAEITEAGPAREEEAGLPQPAAGSKEPELPVTQLRAPLVGTFYRSPEAGLKPYAEVGDRVRKGDTVCIIDAMKMMNYIEAPCDGTLVAVAALNEQMVEYDQLLMEFREDA